MMAKASSLVSNIFSRTLSRTKKLGSTSHYQAQTLAQQLRALPNSEPSTPYSSPRPSFTIERENILDELCSLPEDPILNTRKNPLIENLDHLIYRDQQQNKFDNLDKALDTTKKRLETTLNKVTQQRLKDRVKELETLNSELSRTPTLTLVGFIGWTNQKPDQKSKNHRFSQYDAVVLKMGTQYSLRILNSSGLIHGQYIQNKVPLKKLIPEKKHHFEFQTPTPNQTFATKITIDLESQPSDFSSIQNYLQTLKTTLDRSYTSGIDYYLRDLFELKKQLLEESETDAVEKNFRLDLSLLQENILLFLDVWLWRHSNVAFDTPTFKENLEDKFNSDKKRFSDCITTACNDPSQERDDFKQVYLRKLLPAQPALFSV